MNVGFGKVDITPRVGVELCGFGPYLNRSSTRVLEPLFARAMAVELAGRHWVLVSCDLIGFSGPLIQQIRELVRRTTGWRDDEIMVHATHTHSGPCTVPELIGWGQPDLLYLSVLPRFVAQACIDAVRDLQPASFRSAEVPAGGFSYNRELPQPGHNLELVLAGKWVTGKPDETDTTAHVISVERAGKCAGFLTYFSCHPVVCCQLNREIHGDFVGVATNRLERELPGAVGLFLQGAQGDINSNFVHGAAEQSLVALEHFSAQFAEVIRTGLRAGQPLSVARIDSAISDEPHTVAPVDAGTLRSQLAENEQIVAGAMPGCDSTEVRLALVRLEGLRLILSRQERGELPDRPLTVQALRLGPVTFTGAPLELMHRIKRRFQAELGRQALLLSLTNGCLGYAPLREYYQSPPERYAATFVPVMTGSLPFTENIEDEVVAAALAVTRKV